MGDYRDKSRITIQPRSINFEGEGRLEIGSARLSIGSYGLPPKSFLSTLSAVRVSVLSTEQPRFNIGATKVAIGSVGSEPQKIAAALTGLRTSTLYSEAPSFNLGAIRMAVGSFSIAPKAYYAAYFAGRVALIHKQPPIRFFASRIKVLIKQSEDITPARTGSVYSEFSAKAHYLSVHDTISSQSLVQTAESIAVSADDNGMPISQESAPQSFASWAAAGEAVMPWSKMDIPQAFTVYAANGGYIVPEYVYSPEDVRTVGQLVAMSSLFEYKPISGLTVPQFNYTLASAAEYPWPETLTFPADVGRLTLSWAQKVNMGRMPRSLTRVPYVGTLFSAQASTAKMPWSWTSAVTVGNIIAVASPEPESYRSTTSAVAVGNLVSMASPAVVPTGPIANKSLGLYVAVAADYDEIGPSPSHMAASANVMYASKTRGVVMPKGAAQLGQLAIEWSKGATYPSPEEMYERNAVGQYGQLIGQQSTPWGTISHESVRQLGQFIASHAVTIPPDEVYGSGIFIGQLGQVVMAEAKYPDVRVPFSTIDVDVIGQQLAHVASYPDKGSPQSSVTVSQSVLQVLRSVTYPDLNAPVSFAVADTAGQQVALTTSYPDKDEIRSFAVVDAAGQQLVRTTDYPDKNLVQSKAIVQQLGEQTATVAAYPDKDTPQSQAQVTLIRQQILQRNEALSSMPEKLPKHRAQITITFL